ncbi:MAG: aminotransferase class V-fold PLP-dependent enzyme [Parcubacteria group bacterium]|nr:aminotransferase class V-fold PLP-dependent enzyme [Parcubacteria group bacterium]
MFLNRFDPAEALARARHVFGEFGGINPSIEESTTFTVLDASKLADIFGGKIGPDEDCYLYGRHINPTVLALGRMLAAMENTEAAYPVSSGMASIFTVVAGLCGKNEHIVSSNTVYGGTFALFERLLPRLSGITTSWVDITNLEAVEAAFTKNTKMLFVETLSNPTLVVADLPRLAEIAHRHGVKLVVDNTFTPLLVTPALYGADIVLHSLTKFVNGTSHVIAGVICCNRDLLQQLMDPQSGPLMLTGPTMDPRVAFDIYQALSTLPIRMAAHGRHALVFALRLLDIGIPVVYPGLRTHPNFSVFEKIRNTRFGAGGMLYTDLKEADLAEQFLNILQRVGFGYIAVSLGYHDTLMSCSASSTSSELSDDDLEHAGISRGLIRISMGYTGSADLRWAQFMEALDGFLRSQNKERLGVVFGERYDSLRLAVEQHKRRNLGFSA